MAKSTKHFGNTGENTEESNKMALNAEEQKLYNAFCKFNLLDPQYAFPFIEFCKNVYLRDYGNRHFIKPLCNKMKNGYMKYLYSVAMKHPDDEEVIEKLNELNTIYWEILKMEAQNRNVDSYLLYIEKNRNPIDKFYQPRRKLLQKHGVIQGLQALIDDELDVLTISLPPGTGKTSCEKFFHSAVAGWFPRDFSLFYSHSDSIAKMYYDSVCDIITNDVEYTWKEIFPTIKLGESNAKRETFNVGIRKDFASIQCTSVSSKNAGQYRCSKFLFVDDMIGSIDEALNKSILDKLWNDYAVDARQRKITDSDKKMCKELHIATRWSIHDVIGRLQRMYEDDPTTRARFIAVPDIDPETGESNFAYDIHGYTVEDFKDIEKLMDEISYRCLYKQDPIEREGLLYHSDELRRYTTLPDREPDAIIGVCDTKTTGIDYMFLPVFYVYDNDFYLEDCICDDNTAFAVQIERVSNIIVAHNMQQVEFESNAGGSRFAFDVQDRVKEMGGKCNITSKATESNKETRIIVNSDWIKKNVLFKDSECYTRKDDYGKMMDFLLSYTMSGKNKHDDVPDGLANFAIYVMRKFNNFETVIMRNPFRR